MKPILPIYDTTIPCPACGSLVQWRKRDFTRPDGYHDWALDVFCFNCGFVEDPTVLAEVRRIYDDMVGQRIGAQQAAALTRRPM